MTRVPSSETVSRGGVLCAGDSCAEVFMAARLAASSTQPEQPRASTARRSGAARGVSCVARRWPCFMPGILLEKRPFVPAVSCIADAALDLASMGWNCRCIFVAMCGSARKKSGAAEMMHVQATPSLACMDAEGLLVSCGGVSSPRDSDTTAHLFSGPGCHRECAASPVHAVMGGCSTNSSGELSP